MLFKMTISGAASAKNMITISFLFQFLRLDESRLNIGFWEK